MEEKRMVYILTRDCEVLSVHSSLPAAQVALFNVCSCYKGKDMTDDEFIQSVVEEMENFGCYMDSYSIIPAEVED